MTKNTGISPKGRVAYAKAEGHIAPLRAGSTGVTVSDGVSEVDLVYRIVIEGAGVVTDAGDGVVVVTFDATSLDLFTQDDADALYLLKTYEGHTPETVAAGATETLDLSSAGTFDITLSEDLTLTLSNPSDLGTEGRWTIALRQDSTGGWAVTWPASVVWRDTDGTQTATPPTLATAAGAMDTIDLRTLDGGATYGASLENGSGVGGLTEAELPDAGHYEVVVSGSAPPVAVSTPSDDDWVYAWVS